MKISNVPALKVGTRKWYELQLKLVQLVPYHFINFTQKGLHY